MNRMFVRFDVYMQLKKNVSSTFFKYDEGKVHPVTGHEGSDGEYKYSSTLFLTLVLDRGG